MRALSTLIVLACVARAAAAQKPDAPSDTTDRPLWFSVSAGGLRGAPISDRASNGGWRLQTSAPVTVAFSMPLWGRTLGLRAQTAGINMRFTGPSCTDCAGRVQATMTLATYNNTRQIGNSAFNTEIEYVIGMTSWTGLRGRDGNQLPAAGAAHDFTYGLSVGWSRVMSDRLDALLMIDALSLTHRIGSASVTGVRGGGQVMLYGLRAGARMQLGR
jgi:hypothetical protein